jgi:hypothetical protein
VYHDSFVLLRDDILTIKVSLKTVKAVHARCTPWVTAAARRLQKVGCAYFDFVERGFFFKKSDCKKLNCKNMQKKSAFQRIIVDSGTLNCGL